MNVYQVAVQNYIDKYDCSPLQFVTTNQNIFGMTTETESIKTLEYDSLNNLVEKCLSLTKDFYSKNTTNGDMETFPDRWRSSLDIWRHAKFFKEDLTIFEVLKSIYDIVYLNRDRTRFDYPLEFNSKIVGHYCCDVSRRVFKFKPPLSGPYHLGNLRYRDEYHLLFSHWNQILNEE